MTFLYGVTGTLDLRAMAEAIPASSPLAVVGIGLMAVGFAFKVGAVPFHMWVPDVYEGAPTSVTSFMSVAVKAAGFGSLLRVLQIGLPKQAALWGDMLWAVAALTMIVGNFLAVPQQSVKRMLAYSSIAHAGYVLLGFAALRTGATLSGPAASATIFYLVAYTFMTFGAFATLIYLGRSVQIPGRAHPEWHDAEDLYDFAGVSRKRPWAAAAMTIFLVSLAGIPPTTGFAGKFLLFKAAIANGYIVLAVIGILTSVVSVYYYLRVVVYMYMKDPMEEPPAESDAAVGTAVALAAILTVALGLVPGAIHDLAVRAIGTLR
jgi:NADH-quinone oxidoreductase subunit N